MKAAGLFLAALAMIGAPNPGRADLVAKYVKGDFSSYTANEALWKDAKEEAIVLMAQPMVSPRPAVTGVASVAVKAMHDGEWIVFWLHWSDPRRNEAKTQSTLHRA